METIKHLTQQESQHKSTNIKSQNNASSNVDEILGGDGDCIKKKCESRCRSLSSKNVDFTATCDAEYGCLCHDDLMLIQMDSKPVKNLSKFLIDPSKYRPNGRIPVKDLFKKRKDPSKIYPNGNKPIKDKKS
uniref:Uncharacterized protein n=1 Tax=Cuerna arida TaxID=1464854 RepID=A0A1B6EM26_9HEMI